MVKLKRKDVEFILAWLELTPNQREILKSLLYATPINKSLMISDKFSDELRDLCTETLDVYGFDENYNPTIVGKKLESLIDKLFIE